MEITESKKLEIKAYEAFIRRASIINLPFMLKGSYLTRQYFDDPSIRIPADLDFVYLNKIDNQGNAKQKFNEWATLVTELDIEDGIKFESFKKNECWINIDYAMSDDFPTVNTELECSMNGKRIDFSLDISFNLEIEHPPVPLMYRPLDGDSFFVANTVPVSLQVAWKIHQTLVRPRFKDIFDLIHLVKHSAFDKKALEHSIRAVVSECQNDNVDLNNLKYFLNYEFNMLFSKNSIKENWDYWRHGKFSKNITHWDKAELITDVEKQPSELSEFLNQLKEVLHEKGLKIKLIENLDIPERKENSIVNEKPFLFIPIFEKNIIQNNVELTRNEKKISIWDRLKKIFK